MATVLSVPSALNIRPHLVAKSTPPSLVWVMTSSNASSATSVVAQSKVSSKPYHDEEDYQKAKIESNRSLCKTNHHDTRC